ncbi:hypothetical protein DHEL01_v211651 [Diaporthe helianthi]|uniref:Ankyrin n=1 Tax=Diaporthe helianthi TaxID=158607 RepID=A0A2P5HI94_DIAHE|nr:hypothetical protein DHEL01_v211651 [Diaporthe helianthi]
MSLALRQSVSWYESILGPLHVAILDNKMEALEVILKHIRENDYAYRMIDAELVWVPADLTSWRGRTALSIFVSSSNHAGALSGMSPWRETWPPGSALHWAIRSSNITAVRLLLKNEAALNQVDSSEMTPLRLAVLSRHPAKLVQELLEAGAGLAEKSCDRIEAMKSAIRNGDLELVKTLAQADPETLKSVDKYGADSFLQTAGSQAVYQHLVSQGSDPFEVQVGQSAVTWLLAPFSLWSGFAINSGLVLQSPEDSLVISLAYLAYSGSSTDTHLVKRLRRALPIDVSTRIVTNTCRGLASPICLAASVSAADRMEALITMRTELDSEGCRYGSPLMAACAWGNLDAARCLVRAGALLCYVNDEGVQRSAISAASRHQKVIKWLLVDRHGEQPKLDYQPSQVTARETVWSGPRLFELALPAYMHRDFGESRWTHLLRLQRWREELRGATLAESRWDRGLDLEAGFEAESRQRDAQTAHDRFLASIGEFRYK